MFFPGTLNIFTPGDSAFMLLKCMCNNISIEKKSITLSAQLTMISVSFFVFYMQFNTFSCSVSMQKVWMA